MSEVQQNGTGNGRFQFQQSLGRGAFGSVFLARDTKSTGSQHQGKIRAIKIICIGEHGHGQIHRQIASIRDEVNALIALRHRYIVSIKDVYSFRAGRKGIAIGIVMEYCSRGNLDQYLLDQGGRGSRITDELQLRFMLQLASGIEFMHGKHYAHRDLKPANILLDDHCNVKIADFGLAKLAMRALGAGYNAYMKTVAGTDLYTAPEVFRRRYTDAADIYSAGLVFACITHPGKFCPRHAGGRFLEPLTKRGNTLSYELENNKSNGITREACQILGIDDRTSSPIWPRTRNIINNMLTYDYHHRVKASAVLSALKAVHGKAPLQTFMY